MMHDASPQIFPPLHTPASRPPVYKYCPSDLSSHQHSRKILNSALEQPRPSSACLETPDRVERHRTN
ncbi:hypothetical protein L226DRAFT_538564, partial [Lentinus tigrinus ALCF2SS1-7]|uniref:uncharacterized protein n=1 Tax=Lentinus tigrinus ALCF2SS1-7 TaxID=1328758 RepID=UPI00116626BA